MAIQSINPANEEVLQSFEEHTDAQVDEKLDLADTTFREWREVLIRAARRADARRPASSCGPTPTRWRA